METNYYKILWRPFFQNLGICLSETFQTAFLCSLFMSKEKKTSVGLLDISIFFDLSPKPWYLELACKKVNPISAEAQKALSF